MEKIAKALEKARAQRDARTVPPVQPGGVDASPPAPDLGAPPRYRTTRVVAVDRARWKENRLITDDPESIQLADAFRILRTRVYQRMSAINARTLAITSPNMNEGKSVVAANLAISLTQFAEHTVLLVDVDLRRPSLHKTFGIEPKPGLSDYLVDDTPLSECLVSPDVGGLVVLPAGSPLARSSEALSSTRMAALADELKNRYPDRIVLYDLPPLLPTDDALVFLPFADAALLVIEEGRTRAPEIERAVDMLESCHLLGTVLNKSTSSDKSYAYV